MTTIPMKRSDKCAGNKWNSVAPSDKKTRRTWYQDGHFSAQHENRPITTITSPQATCSQGNWSLLPSVVHRRGLWKLPHTRLHNYPRKTQTKVRHNRAAQAEVTTPYPGPRFPAATVAHCRINAWAAGTGEDRQRERDMQLGKIYPEEKEKSPTSIQSPSGKFRSYILHDDARCATEQRRRA